MAGRATIRCSDNDPNATFTDTVTTLVHAIDLVIQGDSGDTVHLSSSYSAVAGGANVLVTNTAYGGGTFDIYSDGTHFVAVQDGVTVATDVT